jgi:threonine dehydratase
MQHQPPTCADIAEAGALVRQFLARTPLIHSPALSAASGTDVWLKCECFAEIGAFKARGALVGVHKLDAAQRAQGLICASTGNHGAAMAWAARRFGALCTVVAPVGTPEIKVNNMINAGARLLIEGADWSESCRFAREIAEREHLHYLEDGENPWIMAGAGTVALEILEDLPDAQALLIPVGGGNFMAGCAIAAGCVSATPPRLIGVQSEAAPAATVSMRAGVITRMPTTTFAGGIATTEPVPMAFEVMRARVDEMLLVGEDELFRAIGQLVRTHAIVTEGAGAAPLAALLRYSAQFAGQRVVLVLSGRNLDPASLQRALGA